jgi:hypothetical protein
LKNTRNKFLNLLESFSASELTEFRKFVASPFISSGRNYLPLISEIIRQKSGKNSEYNLQELHNKLYPGKKFSSQTLKNRFSELFKIGEEFLIFKSLSNNSSMRDRILLSAYVERDLEKFFESNYRKVLDRFEGIPNDERKFESFVEFQRINIANLVHQNRFDKYFPAFYESSIYQTCLSFINLFEFGMEFRQQDYLNKKYDFNIVPEILMKINFEELAKKTAYRNSPIFKFTLIYYHLYKCYENLENENDYFEARKIFKEIKPQLSDDAMLKIYMMCIYYCTHKQNLGLKKFRLELFNLYKEKLESGFISDFAMNTYPLNNFRDYVLIGIELKELDWVEKFLEDYSGYLPDQTRDDEVYISRSKLLMASSKFSESLELLNKTKPSNFIHYIDVSTGKLCNFYELEMTEEAFSEIDKLKHYLRNHKEVPKVHKTYTSNFLRIYSMLLKARTEPSFADVELIGKELKSTTFINRQGWLKRKLAELRG